MKNILWRLVLGAPIVFSVVRIILFKKYFNFDTPLYYLIKNKADKARDILESIYYKVYVEEILKDLKYELKSNKIMKGDWKGLFSDKMKYRTTTGILL